MVILDHQVLKVHLVQKDHLEKMVCQVKNETFSKIQFNKIYFKGDKEYLDHKEFVEKQEIVELQVHLVKEGLLDFQVRIFTILMN